MNIDQAKTLNAALCDCYLFQAGIFPQLRVEAVRLVAQAPLELLVSATEQVHAMNCDAEPDLQGKTEIFCTVDDVRIPELKRWAEQRWQNEWRTGS